MTTTFHPAAIAAERVGFFGGTFDPPHRGHLFVAHAATVAHGLDHVVWAPARLSPRKADAPTPGPVRAELVALCLADAAREGDVAARAASVWLGELERPQPSYTVDSLRELTAARKAAGRTGGLYLLLGGDQLGAIETWSELETVLALAEPVILARPGAGPEAAQRLTGCVARGELSEPARQRIVAGCLDPGRVDLAATELRARLSGEARVDTTELTPGVLERVRELRLYR